VRGRVNRAERALRRAGAAPRARLKTARLVVRCAKKFSDAVEQAPLVAADDPDGTAARVLRNLLDLLPVTKNAIALPLPSYSLKVVEEYVGYKRTQDEYGGTWAMAQFILATETEDQVERNARMEEILKYNAEDLAATWAVFEWLRSKSASGRIA